MKEVVSQFAHIVQSSHIVTEQVSDQKLVERCDLMFIDRSRLVAYESKTGGKFKYSYQWMNESNQTIYRWDNATHFSHFNTSPYHRHVGVAETAEPFPIVSFYETLQFIADQLTVRD